MELKPPSESSSHSVTMPKSSHWQNRMPNLLPRWFRLPWIPIAALARSKHYLKAKAHVCDTRPIHKVDPRFLSFSIDISVLAGGFWWEGGNGSRKGLGTLRVAPLNLNSAKLDILTQALGPAYLRIGGSEADKIHYFTASADEPDALILQPQTWDDLHKFKERNQLQLVFTAKYGLFKRTQHGLWQDNEVSTLLDYSRAHDQTIEVIELGNELNAYWAFHGLSSQPRAHHLAVDYHRFIDTVKAAFPNCRIMGPGSAYWPKLGETIKPFSNITKRFLEVCQQQNSHIDIVDWHYYPFQSTRSPVRTRAASLRNMIKPSALNDFARYSHQLKTWRDEYCPSAQLWTGETGSAQCGGQPKLSDRFISCFWWADQLGLAARSGHSVMIRQSLIGGDYGMIDRLTLKPRPDYWLSWIWKQLMGEEVYAIDCSHHMLRCYCHNYAQGPGKVLLIINLSSKAIHFAIPSLGRVKQQWTLTAKRLKSRKLRINGEKARYRGGKFELNQFPERIISDELPGYSVNFWRFEE